MMFVGMMKGAALVGALNIDTKVAFYHAAQAGLSYFEGINFKVNAYAQKLFLLSSALNFTATVWTLGRLVETLDQNYEIFKKLSSLNKSESLAFNYRALGFSAAWILLSCTTFKVAHRILKGDAKKIFKEAVPTAKSSFSICWSPPSHHLPLKCLYVTRLTATVALALFSEKKLFFALNSLFLTYSLTQLMKQQWLELSRTFLNPDQCVKKLTTYYYAFLIPYKNKESEMCVVCQEKTPSLDYLFDQKHALHSSCIMGLIHSKSDSLHKEIEYNRFGRSNEKVRYDVCIPEKEMPKCPLCRHQPETNHLEVIIKDHFAGNIRATVIEV